MEKVLSRARVLHNYIGEDDSHLSLEIGQMISVFDQDESGWWEGVNEMTGDQGLFPSTYVEELFDYLPEHGGAMQEKDFDDLTLQSWEYAKFDEPSQNNTKTLRRRLSATQKDLLSDDQFYVKAMSTLNNDSKYQRTVTRFGIYAKNMMILNMIGLVGTSVFAFVSQTEGEEINVSYGLREQITWVYCAVLGASVSVFEYMNIGISPSSALMKSAIYFILSAPVLSTFFTVYHGLLMLLSSFIFLISFKCREYVSHEKPTTVTRKRKKRLHYFTRISKEKKWGRETFRFLFIAGNIIYLVLTATDWYSRIRRRRDFVVNNVQDLFDTVFPFTWWLPLARVGGAGLNIAGTFILFPVCRTFIRQLYDYSTQNHSGYSVALRRVLWLFPLDKALYFHEKLGWLILFYATIHTVGHLVNAALVWDQVVAFYGWSPLITGFLLWQCIFFMYPAVIGNVKNGHFEIFWYSHHFFIPFFLLCIIHGRGSIGPTYWKFFILPGSIYLLERLYRYYSAYQTVGLVSVTNMYDKVVSIEFDKSCLPGGYLEGQYVFLKCPFISKGQWHPFTISSAPGDPTVTIHIKILGNRSWTKQLMDYLTLMGPKDASYFELSETLPNGGIVGKTIGPSGEKILQVYGPHSAPTEHTPEYPVDMIIGSGIGITPAASTMQQIVFHRWKFNVGSSSPDHAYFGWVCPLKEVDDYRWMIRIVKEANEEVHDLRSKGYLNDKTFEVHIWVTSVGDQLKEFEIGHVENDAAFWGRRRKIQGGGNLKRANPEFDELELYKLMKAPPKEGPTKLGYCYVYNGRPKWEDLFDKVSKSHVCSRTGVLFCGNPRISTDLKDMCRTYSTPRSNRYFVLHKENF